MAGWSARRQTLAQPCVYVVIAAATTTKRRSCGVSGIVQTVATTLRGTWFITTVTCYWPTFTEVWWSTVTWSCYVTHVTSCSHHHHLCFNASTSLDSQEAYCSPAVRSLVRPSVRSFVPSSVTELANTIFWKRMNRFWCKSAQVVHRARGWNSQLWGPWSQRSRSHNVKVRFEFLAEASFSTRSVKQVFYFVALFCTFVAEIK